MYLMQGSYVSCPNVLIMLMNVTAEKTLPKFIPDKIYSYSKQSDVRGGVPESISICCIILLDVDFIAFALKSTDLIDLKQCEKKWAYLLRKMRILNWYLFVDSLVSKFSVQYLKAG